MQILVVPAARRNPCEVVDDGPRVENFIASCRMCG